MNIAFRICVHISPYLAWGKLWSTLNCWLLSPSSPLFPSLRHLCHVIHLLIHRPMHWLRPPPLLPLSPAYVLYIWPIYVSRPVSDPLHWTIEPLNVKVFKCYCFGIIPWYTYMHKWTYIYIYIYIYASIARSFYDPHHWTIEPIEPIEHFKSLAIPRIKGRHDYGKRCSFSQSSWQKE